jgi:hypothetical protein
MDAADFHPSAQFRLPVPAFDERQRALILARPDMLTLSDFAERFGIRRALLDKRHAAGQLLALRLDGKQRYRCPAWQGRMVSDEASRKVFERLLELLGPGDPWSMYRFFTTASDLLGGKTPVEAWKASPPERLEAAAKAWPRIGLAPG